MSGSWYHPGDVTPLIKMARIPVRDDNGALRGHLQHDPEIDLFCVEALNFTAPGANGPASALIVTLAISWFVHEDGKIERTALYHPRVADLDQFERFVPGPATLSLPKGMPPLTVLPSPSSSSNDLRVMWRDLKAW